MVSHHVEIQRRPIHNRKDESNSLTEAALVDAVAATLGCEIADPNSPMFVWSTETIFDPVNQFADLLTFFF